MTARTLSDLREALELANVQAFLRVIRQGESSQDDRTAYTIQYGGKHFAAPPWAHPREKVNAGRLTSTAAGAYQFLASTWDALVAKYRFPDFSPPNQDLGAVALIYGRGALDDVVAGRLEAALEKCCREWASLPGSPYGQPTMSLEEARDLYLRFGGTLQAPAATSAEPQTEPLATEHYDFPQEATMPGPLVPIAIAAAQAFLPKLIDLIPALGGAFGSGSEVQKRNVAAATIVAKAVTEAVGSPNLQTAIEAMERDPGKLAQAQEAVHELIPTLLEVGGGGIEGARKAAANPDQVPPWKNPAVIIAAAILPLVYLVAVAVLFGVGGQTWSDDIKTLFVTAIVTGALGSITGFFLGSSLGSQAKDARARQFARE